VACDEIFPDGHFRIVSVITGQDLVFGSSRIYDKNQIKFYSLMATDTTFFNYQAIKIAGTGYDSVLRVRFYPSKEVAYMRLSNGDIDTLNISFKSSKTKCCGTSTQITNFRYNNSVNIPGDKGIQELKK
jgi:hypothetical protein